MSKTKIILPPSARAKLKIPPRPLPPSELTRASSSPAVTTADTSITNLPDVSTTSLLSTSSESSGGIRTPSSSGAATPTPTTPPASPPAGIAKRRRSDGQQDYQLTRRNISNYDSLASQLLDTSTTTPYPLSPSSVSSAGPPIVITTSDGEEKTHIKMDINLSVDIELLPSVHGDLQLSMLCVAIKQDPAKAKTVSSGKRLVGTILRVSDDKEMVYRQVVGLTSWGEWWWVCRTQLVGLTKRKAREKWEDLKESAGGRRNAMGFAGAAGLITFLLLWWATGLVLVAMRWGLCKMVCPSGS